VNNEKLGLVGETRGYSRLLREDSLFVLRCDGANLGRLRRMYRQCQASMRLHQTKIGVLRLYYVEDCMRRLWLSDGRV
jgi:hypothetical protein